MGLRPASFSLKTNTKYCGVSLCQEQDYAIQALPCSWKSLQQHVLESSERREKNLTKTIRLFLLISKVVAPALGEVNIGSTAAFSYSTKELSLQN